MRLETERLTLKPMSPEDCRALHALWTDPRVRRYLWDDIVIGEEVVTEVIDGSVELFRTHRFGFWTLRPRSHPKIVGFAGLRRFGDDGEIELLYGLHPDSWGQGLATEAARRVLDYAFGELRLEAIHAGADPPNVASLRVMDRLGFGPPHPRTLEGLELVYRSMVRTGPPVEDRARRA